MKLYVCRSSGWVFTEDERPNRLCEDCRPVSLSEYLDESMSQYEQNVKDAESSIQRAADELQQRLRALAAGVT